MHIATYALKKFELVSMAERVGFEPTNPFGLRALQARALGQAMRPLPTKTTVSRDNNKNLWSSGKNRR